MLEAALERLSPRKPVTTAAFAVLLVAASVVFAFTAAGHYSTYESERVTGTVTGYEVVETDSGPVLAVDVYIDNPLLRPVGVGNAELTARVDGQVIATSGGIYVDETVAAGASETVTIQLRPNNGETERMRSAAADGEIRVTGNVRGTIEAEDVQFGVVNDSRGGAGE